MLDTAPSGRHRGATRYNPWSELSTIVKSAGQNGVKATAVLAASGGLAATFALPAQAQPRADVAAASEAATAPAAAAAPVALAPSVVAPAVAAPVATEVVGVVGVTAVAKPKPKPRPVVVQAEVASSRGNTSASRSTSARSTTSTKKASTQTKATSANVPQSASGVVNIARGLLGIPYVYGGSTPSGFDCSGFTQYVFRKAGISIPRTASAQQRAATRVSNPEPGDLVFFGSPAWHVGIYTGNGMMIDSP
ncbi:MAG TPA: C40 family peptidase, partial [Ornithinibacter sp.]|nr:C40 family peptidase [Ornithinibacter sp.]HQW75112.1 C40 family peptidase [Ornithinibacter sp.]